MNFVIIQLFQSPIGSLKKINNLCRRRAICKTSEEVREMGGWRDNSQIGVLQQHHHDRADIDIIHRDPAAAGEQAAPHTNISQWVYKTSGGHAETEWDSGTVWLVAQMHRSCSIGYLTMLKLYSQMKRSLTVNWERWEMNSHELLQVTTLSTHQKGQKKTWKPQFI